MVFSKYYQIVRGCKTFVGLDNIIEIPWVHKTVGVPQHRRKGYMYINDEDNFGKKVVSVFFMEV